MEPEDLLPEPSPVPRHSRRLLTWAIVAILAVGGCLMAIPAVLLPALAEGAHKKQSTDCMLYLRQIGESMALYAQDYDDHLPPAEWIDALGTRIARDKFLHCPSVSQSAPGYGYALNAALVGRSRAEIGEPSTPMVFDTALQGRNAVAELDSMPAPPRHLGVNHQVRLDGQVPGFRLRPGDEAKVAGG